MAGGRAAKSLMRRGSLGLGLGLGLRVEGGGVLG